MRRIFVILFLFSVSFVFAQKQEKQLYSFLKVYDTQTHKVIQFEGNTLVTFNYVESFRYLQVKYLYNNNSVLYELLSSWKIENDSIKSCDAKELYKEVDSKLSVALDYSMFCVQNKKYKITFYKEKN